MTTGLPFAQSVEYILHIRRALFSVISRAPADALSKNGWGVEMHPPVWVSGLSVRHKRTAGNTRYGVIWQPS